MFFFQVNINTLSTLSNKENKLVRAKSSICKTYKESKPSKVTLSSLVVYVIYQAGDVVLHSMKRVENIHLRRAAWYFRQTLCRMFDISSQTKLF